jgi:hypothetical protein
MEMLMGNALASSNEDRISYRRRWRLVAMSVVVWLLNNVVNATPDVAQALNLGSTREFDIAVLVGFWLTALCLVWMVAGVSIRRNPVLNDELTRAHRATAIQLGYWGLLAIMALAFAWSHSGRHVFEPVSFEHLMVTAVTLGAVGPALLFAILDWKAEKVG